MDEKLIEKASHFFKILGDFNRLRILSLLRNGEANVSKIASTLDIEQSNVSHQLKTLKDHRFVTSRREGKAIYYALDDHHIETLLDQVFDHLKEGKANGI